MLFKKLIGIFSIALLSTNTFAQNPYAQPDQSWISISGTVVEPKNETFGLDYGDGFVTVEMDDWDAFSETISIKDGDKVTVYGEVDDDLYERTTIEASSVYMEDLNTYYYANSADEEEYLNWSLAMPVELTETTFVGTVSEVHPLLGTFILGKGENAMKVDVSPMPYDPLDDDGFQRIEEGDRVSVNGFIDNNFFTGHELNAESVTTLLDSSRS